MHENNKMFATDGIVLPDVIVGQNASEIAG
jgi:hypothetical protein